MTVEVERKFVCDVDTQSKLREMGAVCVGQYRFQDQYFDTTDFQLTLRDVWLRHRQGVWELKCPAFENLEAGLCSRYKEITDLPEIMSKVRDCLGLQSAEGKANREKDVEATVSPMNESWLQELSLAPFATFATERWSYTLVEDDEEDGVRVDLDQADFGFCVGEIEVLVPEGGDVQAALKKIENTAHQLGLSSDRKVPGKMHTYLQRYRPEHYEKLLNANVL